MSVELSHPPESTALRFRGGVWVVFKWSVSLLSLGIAVPLVVNPGWILFGGDPPFLVAGFSLGLVAGVLVGSIRARRRQSPRLLLAIAVGAVLSVPAAIVLSQVVPFALFVTNITIYNWGR